MQLHIHFDDFTPEMQEQLLDFYGAETPEEVNWDILPVITLEVEEEN